MDTIDLIMGTSKRSPTDALSAALFGKGRRKVLGLLFSRPDELFYFREIARWAGAGLGAAQRELHRLAIAGIVRRTRRGNQVYFQADAQCPIFAELRGIVLKTAGVGDVLRAALASLASRIRLAFVYGSIARGEPRQASDVDLCVVGEVTFAEVVEALAPAQDTLAREINPTVYSPDEFERKLAENHPFVSNILAGPRIVLMGDEGEPGAHTNSIGPASGIRPAWAPRRRNSRTASRPSSP